MDKKIEVKCECLGAGFVAVADSGGDGIEQSSADSTTGHGGGRATAG